MTVLLGGGVVVIYSAIGGMWSLTLTDIVQFVIKTVGLIFILLPICMYCVGGWDQLVAKLPASSFSWTTIGWDTIITYFLIYFFGILISQDIWQRVFTARTEDLLPRLRGGKQSSLGINRLFTLLTGFVVLGIALVVHDVISALTLAYNLLVGGMLIPLIGAIFWKRATTSGAISSMALGFLTALAFMIKDGLDANTPIYYSLAVGLVSFVMISLFSPRPVAVTSLA